MMNKLLIRIKTNPELIFRLVLFFAFFGHGLVSLGFSTSIKLHYALVQAVNDTILSNFINLDSNLLVSISGWFDIIISFLILFKIGGRNILKLGILYLSIVAITALLFYFTKTGKIFGFAEVMRRFPWIFYSLFLIYSYKNSSKQKYNILRIGLAFAFLSHGLASLGIWGLNAGHVELANNIIKTQDVATFMMISGFADTIIGTLLILGLKSQWVSKIALIWITFIVIISFMTGIPDGIFRTGFLLSALYVAIDERCHSKTIFTLIKK